MNANVRLLLHRCCSSTSSVDVGEPASLISWVREQGGRVGALQQQQQGNPRDGYGLTTTAPVRAGETLIDLPPHLPLSVGTEDSVLLALFDRIPGIELFARLRLVLGSNSLLFDGAALKFELVLLFGFVCDQSHPSVGVMRLDM